MAAWHAPVLPRSGSADFAAWTLTHCPADVVVVMGAAQYDGTPSGALERRLAGAAGVAWLAARGVPEGALLAETEARTTVENLQRTAMLVQAGRWIVVTDDLHTVRTRYAAERLGLQVELAGVATRAGRPSYAVREVVALVAYRLGAFR